MKTYYVKTEWSGYSRGTARYTVEAESEEDARENWCRGFRIDHLIVRDDTENEVISVVEKDA